MKDMLNQWKLRGERAEPKSPEFAEEDIAFFDSEHDEEDFQAPESAFVGLIGCGAAVTEKAQQELTCLRGTSPCSKRSGSTTWQRTS